MNRTRYPRAFTLVELLVVIGIIAVLTGLLMPSIKGARLAAKHTQMCAGLREMQIGYIQYYLSNKGALLYAYPPSTVNGVPIVADDPISGQSFGYPVGDRYPWRLAPYVGNIWAVMHIHEEVPPIPRMGDAPGDAFMKAYNLSIMPSVGINAVYVGGYNGPIFAGFGGSSGDMPNIGKHVVFRASEVKRPSELIVFAESVARNAPFGNPDAGMHFVTPPRANGQRWKVVAGKFELPPSGVITGLPQGRFGKRAAVSFFDGHVESRLPEDLEDMRLWANAATTATYDFVP